MKTRRLAIEAGAILNLSSVFAHGNSSGPLHFNDAERTNQIDEILHHFR